MTLPLPAEVELMAACCRWPPSDARREATRHAATSVDWDHFDRVVARHRVAGLVADGLRRADIDVSPAIASSAIAAATQALGMARETVRLQQAFDAEGLPAVFVKGAALALLAYRELAVKQSWDIDLLVEPANAVAGRRLLEAHGYRLMEPVLTEEQFVRFLAHGKECVFINRELGIAVELHWRLISNARFLPGVTAATPLQEVRLGGHAVRTLADEPLFAYLCAHGTIHGWARLKWIADVNAFLGGGDVDRIEGFYETAVQLGAGRTPGVALLLCHRLFGLPLNARFLRRLRDDRRMEQIVATGLQCIAHGRGAREIDQCSSTGLRMAGSHFLLVPGAGYAWSHMREMWLSAHDRTTIRLPAPFQFLYHIIRIPLFLTRLYKRSRGWAQT